MSDESRPSAVPPAATAPDSVDLAPPASTAWAWRIAVLAFALIVGFSNLAGPPSLSNEDAFVAVTAREMLQRIEAGQPDGWFVPYFAGEKRFQKSPLPYWSAMAVASVRAAINGDKPASAYVDRFSVRLPNALYVVLLSLLIFEFSRRHMGESAGGLAGLVTAGSLFSYYYAFSGSSDLGVAFWCVLTLLAAFEAIHTPWESPEARRRRLMWWLLAYLAAGIGMLQKAPMPLAFCGPPILLYALARLAIRKEWRTFWEPAIPIGLLLFLASFGWWAGLILATDSSAAGQWYHEYVGRYVGEMTVAAQQAAERGDSFGERLVNGLLFYATPVLILSLPWTLSVLFGIPTLMTRDDNRQRWLGVYLLLFVVCGWLMLAIGAHQEMRYALPLLPPLFIALGAHYADLFATGRERRRLFVLPSVAIVGLAASVLAGAVLLLDALGPSRVGNLAIDSLSLGPAVERTLRADVATFSDVIWPRFRLPMIGGAITIALLMIAAASLYQRRQESAAFVSVLGGMAIVMLVFFPAVAPILDSSAEERALSQFLLNNEEITPDNLRYIGTVNANVVYHTGWPIQRVFPRDPTTMTAFERTRVITEADQLPTVRRVAELLSRDEPIFIVGEERALRMGQALARKNDITLRYFPVYPPRQTEAGRTAELRQGGNPLFNLVVISNQPQRGGGPPISANPEDHIWDGNRRLESDVEDANP